MIQAILFDVDGVLLNSFEANLKFLQDLMKEFGFPITTREEYQKLFHLPVAGVARSLSVPESVIPKMIEARQNGSVRYPNELTTMPDGAKEVIDLLSEKYSLGIVTSKVRVGVTEHPLLGALKDKFQTIIAYEDTQNHKPHPEPLLMAVNSLELTLDQVIYVGDSETDFDAAKAAGMKFIHFADEPFRDVGGHATRFSDLPKVIETIDAKNYLSDTSSGR